VVDIKAFFDELKADSDFGGLPCVLATKKQKIRLFDDYLWLWRPFGGLKQLLIK